MYLHVTTVVAVVVVVFGVVVVVVGQAPRLHATLSVALPTHSAPPSAGEGLLHERVRAWVPTPQETEHDPELVQADQPPSTGVVVATVDSVGPDGGGTSLQSNLGGGGKQKVGDTIAKTNRRTCQKDKTTVQDVHM